MRKTFQSFIVVLALLCAACSHNKAMTVREEYKTKTNEKHISITLSQSPLIEQYKDYKSKNVVVENKEVEDKRPFIKDVDLPEDIQNYIWEKSIESDLSYALLLAVSKVESDFNPKLVSDTNDVGLFQVHRPTDKFIANELGVVNYNLKDPRLNVDFAVFYLSYLRDIWRQEGASEEDIFDLTIISFNRGFQGAKNYLRHRSIDDNTYLQKVREWKQKFEKGAVDN